ncbi:MAG: hypothetical protein EBX50_21330, partial [Chitinophagia bacterium]|nr:hypothetical protein [Chitinophagia bacterium]
MLPVVPVLVKLKGLKLSILTSPLRVIAKLLVLESTKRLAWQVSKLVLATEVRVVVAGVKFAVYKAVPLTMRKLEMYPGKYERSTGFQV